MIRRALLAALALALPSSAARADVLAEQVKAIVAEPGDTVQVGVWFGTPGAPIFELEPGRSLPAASVVKTALLIELFAAHAGHLDDALGASLETVLADDKNPAMTPFSPQQRTEIRAAFQGATPRTVGAIMMASTKASNAVYNAAANVVIALLGGPAEATAKVGRRDAAFAGVQVRRYMLASRIAHGDNEATPVALAAVLAAIAGGHIAGVDAATADAIAQTMNTANDRALGVHRHKEGNLDNDPMTCVKTGFFVSGKGAPPVIYVVAAALSAPPSTPRAEASRRLARMTDAILAVLTRPSGRERAR